MNLQSPFGRGWFAVSIAVVLLPIAGWCAVWLFARSRAEAQLDALAHGVPGGLVALVCGERSTGGFPFDLVMICRDPVFTVAGDSGPVMIRLARLTASASLLSPQRVSADLTGPLTAQDAGGRTQAGWTNMHIDADGASPEFRSFVLRGAGLNLSCETCFELLRASRVEAFDLRFERKGETRDYAFSVAASGVQNALLLQLTASDRPAAFAASGTITQFEIPNSLRLAAEAERWRRDGGQVSLGMASLDQEAMHVQVVGIVRSRYRASSKRHVPTRCAQCRNVGLGLYGLFVAVVATGDPRRVARDRLHDREIGQRS